MIRSANYIFLTALLLWGALCSPVWSADKASAKPAEPDLWSSIESTIEDLADPFLSKIAKPEPEYVPPVQPEMQPPDAAGPAEPIPPPEMAEPLVPEKPVINLPVLSVTGIIYNTKVPMAIINGQVIAIGEPIVVGGDIKDPIKLKAVHEDSIDVDFMDETRTIPMAK